jgi:uncharacterized membrane protein
LAIAIALHVLAAVLWVGGMFFAWMILRPVAGELLDPPARLTLWFNVFRRFFPWVWASVIALLGSGFWMLFSVFGGMAEAGWHIHVMLLTGLVMTGIYLHLWFTAYRKLGHAVAGQEWKEGGRHLGRIRRLIGINLILGLVTVIVASGGRFI